MLYTKDIVDRVEVTEDTDSGLLHVRILLSHWLSENDPEPASNFDQRRAGLARLARRHLINFLAERQSTPDTDNDNITGNHVRFESIDLSSTNLITAVTFVQRRPQPH